MRSAPGSRGCPREMVARPQAASMPSERSAKSAMVVPAVVVAKMTLQYGNGRKRRAAIWVATATTKTAIKPERVTPVQRHRDRIAAGLAQGGRDNLDRPEGQRDRWNLTHAIICLHWLHPNRCIREHGPAPALFGRGVRVDT